MIESSELQLSVVLPVQNQADHIVEVIRTYIAALTPIVDSFELVPVLNASSDASQSLIAECFGDDDRVRTMTTDVAGWGNAVLLGITAARGAHVCYTNSSRTTGDELLQVVHAHNASLHTLTKAQRTARRPWYRAVGSWLYNLEAQILFGVSAGDINGTPKIATRETLASIPLTERGDFVDLELLYRCRQRGIPVKSVPMSARARLGGRSTTGLKTAISLLTGALVRRVTWSREVSM